MRRSLRSTHGEGWHAIIVLNPGQPVMVKRAETHTTWMAIKGLAWMGLQQMCKVPLSQRVGRETPGKLLEDDTDRIETRHRVDPPGFFAPWLT